MQYDLNIVGSINIIQVSHHSCGELIQTLRCFSVVIGGGIAIGLIDKEYISA